MQKWESHWCATWLAVLISTKISNSSLSLVEKPKTTRASCENDSKQATRELRKFISTLNKFNASNLISCYDFFVPWIEVTNHRAHDLHLIQIMNRKITSCDVIGKIKSKSMTLRDFFVLLASLTIFTLVFDKIVDSKIALANVWVLN